ncbi:MAG: DUF1697 domain-containing protein [Gemmatimonadaceae bacterium]
MTAYIALLRAVNVGGTGKIAMEDLKAMCEADGFLSVRTYIASGNVVFESPLSEKAIKKKIESRLLGHAGKPVDVIVRTAKEMIEVLEQNPFPDAPGNRTIAIFLDSPPPANVAETVSGRVNEEVRAGKREIYVLYDENMGRSKLKIPAAKNGTGRNMNTVAKLAAMASG